MTTIQTPISPIRAAIILDRFTGDKKHLVHDLAAGNESIRVEVAYLLRKIEANLARTRSYQSLTGETDSVMREEHRLFYECVESLGFTNITPSNGNPVLECPVCHETWQSQYPDGSEPCPNCDS